MANLEQVVWWRRLLRPFARPFAYYGRPHCRFPSLWKDKWGLTHVVCSEPPVDTIDVKGFKEIAERLRTDDDFAAAADLLPYLLDAMMDETGGVPVCEAHRNHVDQELGEMFDKMNEQQQQAFKGWIAARKQTGTS